MPLSNEDEQLYEEAVDRIELLWSTGYPQIDEAIRGAMGLFELSFPDRISGYYVAGSHANQTAISTSDLDLHPLFRDSVGGDERARARQLGWLLELICPFELGMAPKDDADPVGYNGLFKLSTRCIFGEDRSDTFPLPSIERYIHGAYNVIALQDIRSSPIACPVGFPDPDAPYFGYTSREAISLSGETSPGTRDLLGIVYTAIIPRIAEITRDYVASKHDAFSSYVHIIGDEWSDLVDDIWKVCRQEWQYRVPRAPADQARLRGICERVLDLENHYLECYRDYWLARLANDQLRKRALAKLSEVQFSDPLVRVTIEEAARK